VTSRAILRLQQAAADLAWQRTIDWFNKYVRG
jgi:dienelactone hydrolase